MGFRLVSPLTTLDDRNAHVACSATHREDVNEDRSTLA